MMKLTRFCPVALALLFVPLIFSCAGATPAIGSQSCATSNDCPGSYRCYPDHHCYPQGALVDCAPSCKGLTPVCDRSSVMCVGCLLDADCPVGALCTNKICHAGCSKAHSLCSPDGGRCDVDMGACRGCLSDAECTDAKKPRCDRTREECVPCLPDHDNCSAGHYCSGGAGMYACAAGCKTSAECLSVDGGLAGDGGVVSLSCCTGACVSIGDDSKNCGACGMMCAKGQSCCHAGCVDFLGDAANCGGCGIVCQLANANAVCSMSLCGVGSCSAGFADCDKKPDNGCESARATDPKNCGACGTVCASHPNTVVSCGMGVCSAVCAVNYADCNKDLAKDGCEVFIGGDLANCGACGNACGAVQNGTALCSAGSCLIGTCNAGYRDCDKLYATGCEVNGNSDIKNCGNCGNACGGFANGVPVCAGGLCGGACNMGFADCDKNAANGCEINLSIDPLHCGSCGISCGPYANASPACAKGACAIAACNANYGDCDKVVANGCEVNLLTSAIHCGACGVSCGMGQCVNGVCQQGCLAGGKQPPATCLVGTDPETASPWTMCTADCNTAWISATGNGGGHYHALQICQGFGYTRLGSYGGTCGDVCGYCQTNTCANRGPMSFDGGGACGNDANGPILCFTVMWQCLK